MDFAGRAPTEEELPVVVVLKKGDLTREEAEGAVERGAAGAEDAVIHPSKKAKADGEGEGEGEAEGEADGADAKKKKKKKKKSKLPKSLNKQSDSLLSFG